MHIKIPISMNENENTLFDLLNKGRCQEVLDLYDSKIGKPIDFLNGYRVLDEKIYNVCNPISYIARASIDIEMFKKLFLIIDKSVINFEMKNISIFDAKNLYPNDGFEIKYSSDPYSNLLSTYSFYLMNPPFARGVSPEQLQENVKNILIFLREQNVSLYSDPLIKTISTNFYAEIGEKYYHQYYTAIIDNMETLDEKIWYALYGRINKIKTPNSEIIENLKQRIVNEKIKNFDFNKMSKKDLSDFLSELIEQKKYKELHELIKNEKIATQYLAPEILLLSLNFTKEKIKSERNIIKACINSILERGVDITGRMRFSFYSKDTFQNHIKEILNTRFSKKLEKERKEEINALLEENIPHLEARLIKNNLNINKMELSVAKKRM